MEIGMSGNCAETILKRLFAIKWSNMEGFNRHEASRTALMAEYLRRAATWANELGGADRWPFFDIAGRVAPAVRADPDQADRLERYLEENVGGFSTENACRWALRWATLRDVQGDHLPRLADPFEPLILMYERGGEIVPDETRSFNFGTRVVRALTWQEHLSPDPIVSLDPATLDALDAEES
ncbi:MULTISPECIES: hypothetical protein [Streptomycetaceae]|uniref:hypothetical protein n=1 Tax=Streptomyces sp. SID5468 TaxID=2690295 RepID=UPI001E3B8F9C|nr:MULTISPECIES: hypothetical protein [Streptomycetaceae]